MRLYSGKIPNIAQDLIRKLKEEGDIEVSDVQEAQLDVELPVRLVHEQQIRLHGKRARYRYTLQHAGGNLVGVQVGTA